MTITPANFVTIMKAVGRAVAFLSHPGKDVRVVSTCLRIARSIKRQSRSASNKMRPRASMRSGCVANFAQVVVQGELPLSVGRLGGQGGEQFGRSEPLVSGLAYHLFFLDHVHEFDSNHSVLGCLKRFEP